MAAAKEETAAVYLDPRELVPWDRNPRKNDHAVPAVVQSIQSFGFGAPIVARRSDKRVVAGHTRLKAALVMGLDKVPVRFMDLTDEQATAMTLADNKLGELSTWDEEALGALAQDFGADVMLSLGWDQAALAALSGIITPGAGVAPPESFPVYDESIPTEHACPKCGYKWSGGQPA